MSSLSGIKIPENCVPRVRDELLQMDDEVKKRRKEKEVAAENERKRKLEYLQGHRQLVENLTNHKTMHTQSLTQPFDLRFPLQHRMHPQAQPTLPHLSSALLALPINASQTQQRTHNSWSNNPSSFSNTNQSSLNSSVSLNLSQFYSPAYMNAFQQTKNLPPSLHQTKQPSSLSSKSPFDDILDLTMSSPSPSPDTTEGGLNLDTLASNSTAFAEDFNLESLISQTAPNVQHAAQVQLPLMLQQPLQASQQQQQQQNHNLLANNHHDLLDYFDISLSPQMATQKASPSSSTSSCSSSTSSTSSVSNNMGSLFSNPSPNSLFSSSSSHFPPAYLLSSSDSGPLPNGNCSSGALDVREALNSMLQAGPDRKSVIQYRPQE